MSISAYTKSCARHTPGIKELWLGLATDVTNGVIASNEVTDIDTTQAEFSLPPDSVSITQEGTGSKNGMFSVEKTIEIDITLLEDTVLAAIIELVDSSPCGITAIYKTNNNQWFCSGFEKSTSTVITAERGLYVGTTGLNSGKELTDEDGDKAVITLKGTFPEHDFVVDDTTAITVDATGVAVAA